MKRLTTSFLTLALLTLFVPTVSAKQTGDWDAVMKLKGLEIAMKIKDGGTSFGLLHSANDAEIQVQIAGKKYLTSEVTVFRRDEIEKVWRATLRFGEKNIGKGALIGAGIGAGVGVATVISTEGIGDAQAGLAIPALAIFGAKIGALVGVFVRKGHKKKELIYSTS